MTESRWVTEVEPARSQRDGQPSASPAYCRTGFESCPPKLEGVRTTLQLWQRSVRLFRIHPCLGVSEKHSGYSYMSYNEVNHYVSCACSTLRQFVCGGEEVIGIWGENCPAWMISFLGCARAGMVSVGLHEELGYDTVDQILQDCRPSVVITSPEKLPKLAAALQDNPGIVNLVVYWGPSLPYYHEVMAKLREVKVAIYHFHEFIEIGELNKKHSARPPKPSDVATIMYSRGPFGELRGLTLTHEAFVSSVASLDAHYRGQGLGFGLGDSLLSCLPLVHVSNLTMELWFLHVGAKVGYSTGTLARVFEDARSLKPSLVLATPPMVKLLVGEIMATVGQKGPLNCIRRLLFGWGKRRKFSFLKYGIQAKEAAPVFDDLVFRRLHRLLGGRQRLVLCTGGNIDLEDEKLLRVCMCCPVHQMYRSQYGTSSLFAGAVADFGMVGTAGVALPSVTWRLQSVPKLGYDALGKVPRGELLFKSTHKFGGFHGRQDLYAEVVDKDGWVHTGDTAEIKDGFLRMIGHKTHVKTSKSEKILVQYVESIYKKSPLIDKIWVYPNKEGLGLTAIAIPNRTALETWAKLRDISLEFWNLCKDSRVQEHAMKELRSTAIKAGLRECEMVESVLLETGEGGFLTQGRFLFETRPCQPFGTKQVKVLKRGLSRRGKIFLFVDASVLCGIFSFIYSQL